MLQKKKSSLYNFSMSNEGLRVRFPNLLRMMESGPPIKEVNSQEGEAANLFTLTVDTSHMIVSQKDGWPAGEGTAK